MIWLRLALRSLHIAALLGINGAFLLVMWSCALLRRRPRAEREALVARILVNCLRDLGATFIKIGQFLSTRPDLVPRYMKDALQELQDRVGPFSYSQMRKIIAEELGQAPELIFEQLDPYPVASASVAQVHQAHLKDGSKVAVKVLRPHIEKVVQLDLLAMRLAARLLRWMPGLSLIKLEGVVQEFSRAILLQLDFRNEAQHNRVFHRCFAEDPFIGVPALVEELCARRVLCMEFIEGEKILSSSQHLDPEKSEHLAQVGFRLLLEMIFIHGIVHADLHPGNLLVHQRRVVMLDLGLVAQVSVEYRIRLAGLLAAWAAQDAPGVSRCLLQLAAHPQELEQPDGFLPQVEELMGRYQAARLGEFQLGQALMELLQMLRAHRICPPPDMTMVLVAIGVVEGLGKQLAPNLDLVAQATLFFGQRGLNLS